MIGRFNVELKTNADPDEGEGDLRNAGLYFKIDTAGRPRRFYNVYCHVYE
jgi:hypothetical protein